MARNLREAPGAVESQGTKAPGNLELRCRRRRTLVTAAALIVVAAVDVAVFAFLENARSIVEALRTHPLRLEIIAANDEWIYDPAPMRNPRAPRT